MFYQTKEKFLGLTLQEQQSLCYDSQKHHSSSMETLKLAATKLLTTKKQIHFLLH